MFALAYLSVPKFRYPNSWMVYMEKSDENVDENWGYPHDLGNTHFSLKRDGHG